MDLGASGPASRTEISDLILDYGTSLDLILQEPMVSPPPVHSVWVQWFQQIQVMRKWLNTYGC